VRLEYGNVVLVDEEANDGILSQLTIAGERIVEQAQYVRADWIDILDRGNESTSVTVQVYRLHADRKVAQLFLLEHARTIPRRALLTITARDGSGGFSNRYLRACGLPSVSNEVKVGSTTIHSYRFIGGEVLNAP